METVQEFTQSLEGPRAFNLFAPRLDDGRADDLHDVGRAGELRAEGVALLVAHRMLKEGAENFGLNFRPVVGRGFAEQDKFEALNFQPRGLGKQAAVEITDALETPAGLRRIGVHGFKQVADEVIGTGGCGAILQNLRDEILGQQINVFGEEGDEHLQDEMLRHRLRHAAFDEFAETVGETIGGLPRDNFAVVVKGGLGRTGREKRERPPTLRQIFQREGVFGRVEVGVEIVNAELVKVAKHDVARTIGNKACPVIESLAVVLLQVRAALFHFDEHDGFPNVIGERRAAAVFVGLADAEFGMPAHVERTGLTEGLKEAIQEDLRLTFFVARDVSLTPGNKFR